MKKLTDIINALVKDRKSYSTITNEEKEYYLFITNRLLSKVDPIYANRLNIKNMDKSMAMDLWYIHLRNHNPWNTTKLVWSKKAKGKINNLKGDDNKLLLKYYNIKQDDLNFLLDNFEEEMKEELKYLKKSI
jgi:hypothetical protein